MGKFHGEVTSKQWHEEGHSVKSKCHVQRKDLSGDSGTVLWASGDGMAKGRGKQECPAHSQMF